MCSIMASKSCVWYVAIHSTLIGSDDQYCSCRSMVAQHFILHHWLPTEHFCCSWWWRVALRQTSTSTVVGAVQACKPTGTGAVGLCVNCQCCVFLELLCLFWSLQNLMQDPLDSVEASERLTAMQHYAKDHSNDILLLQPPINDSHLLSVAVPKEYALSLQTTPVQYM